MTNNETLEDRIERVAGMITIARCLLDELSCAESVEQASDADAAIDNAADLAKDLAFACKQYVKGS